MNLYLVTGTTKGLGEALAAELGADTNNMVVEIARGVSGKNGPNTFIHADFGDVVSTENALKALGTLLEGKQFHRAVLINNAGVVNPVARFDLIDAQSLQNNMTVNVVAPMLTTKAFANHTRGKADSRLVVNISSGAARRAVRGWAAYCAAKAGLEMATRVMAEEVRESDPTLSICSLAPGVVDTPMQAVIREATLESFPERGRFRQMKETGGLRDALAVARDIISLCNTERLANGGNYDIRELFHA
jgi:benzil reductase ((S)-benzoin forming)